MIGALFAAGSPASRGGRSSRTQPEDMAKKNTTTKTTTAAAEAVPAPGNDQPNPVPDQPATDKAKPAKTKAPATKAPAAIAPKAKAAPAKPAPAKAPVARKKTSKPIVRAGFSNEDVALRAYYIAEERQRAGRPGDSHSDWIEAERQLRKEHGLKA